MHDLSPISLLPLLPCCNPLVDFTSKESFNLDLAKFVCLLLEGVLMLLESCLPVTAMVRITEFDKDNNNDIFHVFEAESAEEALFAEFNHAHC